MRPQAPIFFDSLLVVSLGRSFQTIACYVATEAQCVSHSGGAALQICCLGHELVHSTIQFLDHKHHPWWMICQQLLLNSK